MAVGSGGFGGGGVGGAASVSLRASAGDIPSLQSVVILEL